MIYKLPFQGPIGSNRPELFFVGKLRASYLVAAHVEKIGLTALSTYTHNWTKIDERIES